MTLRSAYDAALEYIRRVLLAIDELTNTVLDGQPGDSISHRTAVAASHGKRWGCILCRLFDLFEANHCAKSIAAYDAQVEAEAEDIAKK